MTFYDELGKAATAKTGIPACCTSFTESAFFIAESAQKDFNKVFENIGVYELAVFEATGSVIVYEDSKIKEIANAFKDKLVALWEKIKEAFTHIKEYFAKKIKEFKERFYKVTAADLHNIPKDAIEALKLTYCDFDIDKVYKHIVETSNKIARDVAKASEAKIFKKSGMDKVNEITGSIYSEYESSASSLSELTEAIKKKATGNDVKVDHAWLVSNIDKLNKYALDDVREIKEGYKDLKKTVDDANTKLQALNNETIDDAAIVARALLTNTLAMNSCIMTLLDVSKTKMTNTHAILRAVTIVSRKFNKKDNSTKATKESTDFSSMFEW